MALDGDYGCLVAAALLSGVERVSSCLDREQPDHHSTHSAAPPSFSLPYEGLDRLGLSSGLLRALIEADWSASTCSESTAPVREDSLGRLVRILRTAQSVVGAKRSGGQSRVSVGSDAGPQGSNPGVLKSLFSLINLEALKKERGGSDRSVGEWAYRPSKISSESIFPRKLTGADSLSVARSLSEFRSDLGVLVLKSPDLSAFLTSLLAVMEKHLWCIPSADGDTDVGVDGAISLYDHSKMAAGIASALYRRYIEEDCLDQSRESVEDSLLLVGGDMSGIQSHIYDIASVGVKGVARRLRARSFRISVLLDVFVQRILDDLCLPRACIVMSTGGRFLVLAQDTNAARDTLDTIRRDVSEWVLREFQGELALGMDWISVRPVELEGFSASTALSRLSVAIEREKRRRFSQILMRSDHSISDFMGHETYEHGVCASCRKGEVTESGENAHLCRWCEIDEEIGRRLPRARYVAVMRGSSDENALPGFSVFEDGSYRVIPIADGSELRFRPSLILSLHTTEIDFTVPFAFRFAANYVPVEATSEAAGSHQSDPSGLSQGRLEAARRQPLTFEDIANRSEGNKALSVLKADVDHLGLMFSQGLSACGGGLAAIADLSRMMDLFFSFYVHDLVSREFSHCYVVYSGGDDLMVVGPWDATIELAQKLYTKFRDFTAWNPSITLSAGIAIVKPGFPIARSAEMAGEAEKRSKDSGRDRFTVFGVTINWDKLTELHDFACYLSDQLASEASPINVGFVYRLLRYRDEYLRYAVNGDPRGLLYVSHLIYDIARNIGGTGAQRTDSERQDHRQELCSQLLKLVALDSWRQNSLMESVAYPVSWALYKNRGEKA